MLICSDALLLVWLVMVFLDVVGLVNGVYAITLLDVKVVSTAKRNLHITVGS
jgi:hypothetical protein